MSLMQSQGGTAANNSSRSAGRSTVLWAGRIAGAGLLAWMGWIHLHLWSEGYKHVGTIGPLFIANFVAAITVALVLLSVPRSDLVAVAAAMGAGLAIGTLGGLALSINVGLFGFTDSWNAPFARLSLAVEIAAAVVLLATAAGAAFTLRGRD